MLAKDDDFPTPHLSENFNNSIPIIPLPQTMTETPQSLPRVAADLPPRCRNEPAVLGCATGEVRRMRSVLDMKLGPMAASLDIHLAADVADLFFDGITMENTHEQHIPNKDIITPNRCGEMFDVFGIAIPKSTQAKMQRDGLAEPVYSKSSHSDSSISSSASSFKSDAVCPLFLAESPSRLDLSALLC